MVDLPAELNPTGTFVLTDGEGEVVVQLRDGPCGDTMSGEPYAVRVTVDLGQQKLVGCGLSFR